MPVEKHFRSEHIYNAEIVTNYSYYPIYKFLYIHVADIIIKYMCVRTTFALFVIYTGCQTNNQAL